MRHLTFFSALFFLAFNAHSQLKLGVQAGPNISSISALEKASDLKTDKSSQTSYQTSLLVEYQAIPELAIELGVQYSRQGTTGLSPVTVLGSRRFFVKQFLDD